MFKSISDKIELICAIIIIAIIFYLGKQCGSSKSIEPIPDKVITIINYRDTIFPVDTFYSHSVIPGKPRIIHDTVPIYYLDSTSCNRFYIYDDTIRDSKYDIVSRQIVQGRLSSSDIKVNLKVPLIIKDCTIVKKDSIIFKPSKYELHIGLLSSMKFISPTIDLSVNKSTYTLGYDYFNKTPIIGFKYRLWKSKK